jgi:hypothetical protein
MALMERHTPHTIIAYRPVGKAQSGFLNVAGRRE